MTHHDVMPNAIGTKSAGNGIMFSAVRFQLHSAYGLKWPVAYAKSVEAAKHEAKRCLLIALGGREKHANTLRACLEAIDNMECGKEHNVFLAKCFVPDFRGGHHIHIGMTAAEGGIGFCECLDNEIVSDCLYDVSPF